MPRSIRVAVAVAIAAVAILGTTQESASAATAPSVVRRHMALTKSEPKSDDTLSTSPKAIKLWFSEKVEASAVTIRLTNSKHAMIALGKSQWPQVCRTRQLLRQLHRHSQKISTTLNGKRWRATGIRLPENFFSR